MNRGAGLGCVVLSVPVILVIDILLTVILALCAPLSPALAEIGAVLGTAIVPLIPASMPGLAMWAVIILGRAG